jgi:hypothetical protein
MCMQACTYVNVCTHACVCMYMRVHVCMLMCAYLAACVESKEEEFHLLSCCNWPPWAVPMAGATVFIPCPCPPGLTPEVQVGHSGKTEPSEAALALRGSYGWINTSAPLLWEE